MRTAGPPLCTRSRLLLPDSVYHHQHSSKTACIQYLQCLQLSNSSRTKQFSHDSYPKRARPRHAPHLLFLPSASAATLLAPPGRKQASRPSRPLTLPAAARAGTGGVRGRLHAAVRVWRRGEVTRRPTPPHPSSSPREASQPATAALSGRSTRPAGRPPAARPAAHLPMRGHRTSTPGTTQRQRRGRTQGTAAAAVWRY